MIFFREISIFEFLKLLPNLKFQTNQFRDRCYSTSWWAYFECVQNYFVAHFVCVAVAQLLRSIYLLIQMDQPKRLLCWIFVTSDNFNWDYSEIVCIISKRIWLANIMYSLCCLTRISRECERQRIHFTNTKHVPHPNGRIQSHLHAICC